MKRPPAGIQSLRFRLLRKVVNRFRSDGGSSKGSFEDRARMRTLPMHRRWHCRSLRLSEQTNPPFFKILLVEWAAVSRGLPQAVLIRA